MTKLCPIFSITRAISMSGSNADPFQVCLQKECMYYNDSQDICVISGQRATGKDKHNNVAESECEQWNT